MFLSSFIQSKSCFHSITLYFDWKKERRNQPITAVTFAWWFVCFTSIWFYVYLPIIKGSVLIYVSYISITQSISCAIISIGWSVTLIYLLYLLSIYYICISIYLLLLRVYIYLLLYPIYDLLLRVYYRLSLL